MLCSWVCLFCFYLFCLFCFCFVLQLWEKTGRRLEQSQGNHPVVPHTALLPPKYYSIKAKNIKYLPNFQSHVIEEIITQEAVTVFRCFGLCTEKEAGLLTSFPFRCTTIFVFINGLLMHLLFSSLPKGAFVYSR